MDPVLESIYQMDQKALEQAEDRLMLGGGTRGGPLLVRGKGVRVWDNRDRDYIDCTSQSWALYMGYANDQINDVIRQHIERMTHIHQGFDTQPRHYLAKKLTDLAPAGMNRVSFTVGGGAAVEAAMKICVKNVQPSRDFVCLYDSYHGTTLGSMGASWISTRTRGEFMGGSRFLSLTRPFIRIPNPYLYRPLYGMDSEAYIDYCVDAARQTFERGIAGKPAGVIVEPIQASGGQIILPQRYLAALRELCNEFETLLVFDEIQTFARCGKMFAAEHFGVRPDIIVLGKGLGAGLPLAAVIIADELEGFSPDTEELHTFASPTLSMVTAAKQLAMLESGILENCRATGDYLAKRLRALGDQYPEIGEVRQLGLHIGVEFVADPKSKEPLEKETIAIRDAGMSRGILFGLGGVRKNVLKIKPPLIITHEECDEVIEKFELCVRHVLRKDTSGSASHQPTPEITTR